MVHPTRGLHGKGRIGRYEIVDSLGRGGMAEILLARLRGPQRFERPVAIKRILESHAQAPEVPAMFADEARIAARIDHPNVVQIYELIEDDAGLPCIVMEYLQGESLARVMRRMRATARQLDPMIAAYVVAEAAAGLHAAHELRDDEGASMNVVHRDVSPQNLFLTYEGRVKVVDFGIARATQRTTVTQTGMMKGKIRYMSPEQVAGEELDRRSDLFALGTVLHEALTGRQLFKRSGHVSEIRAIAEEPIRGVRMLRPACPEAIDAVAAKALQRDREERFQTADELREALLLALRDLGGSVVPERALRELMESLFREEAAAKREKLAGLRRAPPDDAEDDEATEIDVPRPEAPREEDAPRPTEASATEARADTADERARGDEDGSGAPEDAARADASDETRGDDREDTGDGSERGAREPHPVTPPAAEVDVPVDAGAPPGESPARPPSGEIALENVTPLAQPLPQHAASEAPRAPAPKTSAGAPGVAVDRAAERREALRQTIPPAALFGVGVALLVGTVVAGVSVFLGRGDLFTMVLDALGLAAITTAVLRLMKVTTRRVGLTELRLGAATLVLSYLAAFGINLLVEAAPLADDEEVAATSPANAPREARAYLSAGHRFARVRDARARAIVDAAYAAGATRVEAHAPLAVSGALVSDRLEITAPAGARGGVERAVRDALGIAANEIDPDDLAFPDHGPWVVPIGFDEE